MLISMAGGSLLGLHDSKPILALRCREGEPSTSSGIATAPDQITPIKQLAVGSAGKLPLGSGKLKQQQSRLLP